MSWKFYGQRATTLVLTVTFLVLRIARDATKTTCHSACISTRKTISANHCIYPTSKPFPNSSNPHPHDWPYRLFDWAFVPTAPYAFHGAPRLFCPLMSVYILLNLMEEHLHLQRRSPRLLAHYDLLMGLPIILPFFELLFGGSTMFGSFFRLRRSST